MAEAPLTVERFFAAMQAGLSAEEEMVALFTDDAVYVEPFSGSPRTHTGRLAVRRALHEALSAPLPQMRIVIDRVDAAGDQLRARWTCHSPALPGGKGSGENLFTLRAGQIARLETRLLPPEDE